MEEPAKFSNWIDSYNSSWTREDLYLVLSVGGTEYLYEKLAANGELDSTSPIMAKFRSARKSTRWRNIHEKSSLVNLMPRTLSIDSGFHFKERVDERDFEAMTSGMLELQVKDAKLVLNQCEIVSLISQKVLVFNRLSHAFRYFGYFLTILMMTITIFTLEQYINENPKIRGMIHTQLQLEDLYHLSMTMIGRGLELKLLLSLV